MFSTLKGFMGFLVGLALTVGLLLTPHLVPGGWGYRAGLGWPWQGIAALAAGGIVVLAGTLWLAGKMIRGARSWKEPRVIGAAVMIALVANGLFMFLVELFGLHSGWRALIAVLGVPVIYGNLVRELSGVPLRRAMESIATGALATLGAGFIVAVILRGW